MLEGKIDGRKLLANIAVSDSSLHIFSKEFEFWGFIFCMTSPLPWKQLALILLLRGGVIELQTAKVACTTSTKTNFPMISHRQ